MYDTADNMTAVSTDEWAVDLLMRARVKCWLIMHSLRGSRGISADDCARSSWLLPPAAMTSWQMRTLANWHAGVCWS